MSTCGFCGNDATLTREDAIPRWITELKPDGVTVRADWEHRNIRKWTFWSNKVELVVRAFCATCNNGWMSDLETVAKPYLLPMLLGYELRLPSKAQASVSAWCMKTAMVMEFVSASPRAHYFTAEERRIFSGRHTPVAGVNINLAGYVGTAAFSAEENPLFFRRGLTRFPGYSCTLQFGALVVQLVGHRGASGYVRIRANYAPAEIRVWPVGPTVTWPPEAVFDDVELRKYATRWLPEDGQG
jgi:hypothetical protein